MNISMHAFRVGIYVEAFNLYYGGSSLCGKGTAGWRWIDIRAVFSPFARWQDATVTRIVYCTARVDPTDDPKSRRNQDMYIAALKHANSVTLVEEGRYVSWGKSAPLTKTKVNRANPGLYRVIGNELLDSRLPLSVVSSTDLKHDVIMATIKRQEEKGSDVNVRHIF